LPAPGSAHTFPASHALQLVTLVARWGITADELLAGSSLREAALSEPHARISADTLRDLSERARSLTAEPGLGFYLGLQKRLSMYGYLGFAQMHAATVRESLELAVRYTPTITTGLSMTLQVDADSATLTVQEHADLGSAHDIAMFSFLVGMRQLTSSMTGRSSDRVRVEIPLSEPEYFARFAHLLPGAVFDAPTLRIRFPARGLDVPLVTPDRAALELAREACERELQALGFDRTLPARVRRLLSEAETFPDVASVARALHQSSRTLKRKLAAEAVSFSELLDAERRARAERLLRDRQLSLDEVAQRLDYSTLPNFTRAFRRWTGQTPASYRKQPGQRAR
jgi:AraC-like DNA-binding protein